MSAKQKLFPLCFCCFFLGRLAFGLLLLGTPISSRADSLEDAARALARKVAASLRGASVVCEERNLSAAQESAFLNFAATFREELQGRNIKVVSHEEAASVLLTLSETVNGYIGVVRVQRGEKSEVFVELLARGSLPRTSRSGATLGLHKELMFSQEDPLVDAEVNRYLPQYMYTLGKQQLTIYQWKESKWELPQFNVLPRKRSPSRDLRGVVGYSVDATAAVFPGEICRFGMQPWHCEPYSLYLRPFSVDWELIENKKLPPWRSAARFEINGHDALVITGEDGLARVYSEGPDAITTIPGWGSEIASTHSGCGNGWQILVTGKGDWSSPDSVTGIEIEGDKMAKVAESIDLPGPVISMHQTQSDKNPSRDMVIAVVHSLQTGVYEVYRLTITCPN